MCVHVRPQSLFFHFCPHIFLSVGSRLPSVGPLQLPRQPPGRLQEVTHSSFSSSFFSVSPCFLIYCIFLHGFVWLFVWFASVTHGCCSSEACSVQPGRQHMLTHWHVHSITPTTSSPRLGLCACVCLCWQLLGKNTRTLQCGWTPHTYGGLSSGAAPPKHRGRYVN